MTKDQMFENYYQYANSANTKRGAFDAFSMSFALAVLLNEKKEVILDEYLAFCETKAGK